MTADPPPRVAAILEPLRPYADEILIAADSRVDAKTLGEYGALADRLFRVEHVQVERHLAWMYAQCSSDWIMRLDGDEIPSSALVRRLPELLATRDVHQFWLRRVWLYPRADRFLDGPPWSEDFVDRLIRNDGTLRARGLQHTNTEPILPRQYLEESLYHLDLLVTSSQQRLDKAVCYEVAFPGLRASGGGRINEAYYLPELRDKLELQDVPAEDLGSIAGALAASSPATLGPAGETVPLVSLAEMDRFWEQRPAAAGAYRARIEPLKPTVSLAPAVPQPIFMHVSNDGTERWPARLEEKPLIRLGYRWLDLDGCPRAEDGPRSAFLRVVPPGTRVLVPLAVVAPAEPGEYVLEVDIVHEHVRWFDCAVRIRASVGQTHALPPEGVRLQETTPPRMQRWRSMRIPRVIHRVWLGPAPMPDELTRFGDAFARHHRGGWEMRLWTDDDLPMLEITTAEHERSRSDAELSNLVRYEVLHRFGGVYADADIECLRSLTPLLRGIRGIAALDAPGRVGTTFLGAVAGNPLFARAARLTRRTLGTGVGEMVPSGPHLLSLLLEQEPGLAIISAPVLARYLRGPTPSGTPGS
jgi:hypothetical protein